MKKELYIDITLCNKIAALENEYTAYKDLLSFCMTTDACNTAIYEREKQNYFEAAAKFQSAKREMINKYFPDKQPISWNLTYATNKLEYEVNE